MKKDFKKFLAVFAVITLLSVWMPGKFKYACAGSGEVCTATVTNIDYTNARFNWTVTGSTSTTKYQAIVYDDSGYSNQIYDTGEVTSSNTYHDIPVNTLDCNTTHYWKIRVYGKWGGTGMAWSSYALSGDLGDDAFTTSNDTTPPSTPVITDDGASTSDNTSLHATWTSTDSETGIAEYQYAISTSATDPGSGYLTGSWVSTGTTANVTTSCEEATLWTQTSQEDFETEGHSSDHTMTSQPGSVEMIIESTIIYMSSASHAGKFGSSSRSLTDSFCQSNKPEGLQCTNTHSFLTISSSDEVRDMPSNYGYDSSYPIYWYHSTQQTFTGLANNWDDMFDDSISVSAASGTGISENYLSPGDSSGADPPETNMCDSSYWNDNWISTNTWTRLGKADLTTGGWLYGTSSSDGCTGPHRVLCACYNECVSSATYTSAIHENTTAHYPLYSTISWNATLPANTAIGIKVRSCDDDACSGETAFSSCEAVANGEDISSNACVNDGDQYIQYEATLTSQSCSTTPSLDDITINYVEHLCLSAGTTYYFHVKAKNNCGDWSSVGNSDGILNLTSRKSRFWGDFKMKGYLKFK